MADIFGESLDILNDEFKTETEDKTFRQEQDKCLANYNGGYGGDDGSDTGARWIMGDEATTIRDMMRPSCYGDPDDVNSDYYFCGTDPQDMWDEYDDYGGVHYNSGVINALFAKLVDSPTQGIGMTKAVGMFFETLVMGVSTDTFAEFGQDLIDVCEAKIGHDYYTPDLEEGASVGDGNVVTTADCDKVSLLAEDLVLPITDYCNSGSGPLLTDEATQLCRITNASSSVIEYWHELGYIMGWACNGDTPIVDPCTPGAWSGVICTQSDVEDKQSIASIQIGYYEYGFGDLPLIDAWSMLPGLTHLDLKSNSFGGELPSGFLNVSSSPDILYISLADNDLTGEVPESLCGHIGTAESIDLSGNSFSCVPKCAAQSVIFSGTGGIAICGSDGTDDFVVDTCTDTDMYSDGDIDGALCTMYTSQPVRCGTSFDDDDFIANEMCCACGGGDIPTNDDDDDDDDDGDIVKDCNYNKKPWKEMDSADKQLVTITLLSYVDAEDPDFPHVHVGIIFMAPKSLDLQEVHLRSKFTRSSWFESAMLPEDRPANIVKVSSVPSLSDTLLKFETAQDLMDYVGQHFEDDDDDDEDGVESELQQFEDEFNFYYTGQVYEAAEFVTFERVRVELSRPDQDGKLRVDACHKMKWLN